MLSTRYGFAVCAKKLCNMYAQLSDYLINSDLNFICISEGFCCHNFFRVVLHAVRRDFRHVMRFLELYVCFCLQVGAMMV